MKRVLFGSLIVLAGCAGGRGPASGPSEARPAAPLLAEGQEVMARYEGHDADIPLWTEAEGIVMVPQGSRLRVVEDPGPESDPLRSVTVYSPAENATGEVGRDELRPLDPGRP